MKRVQVTGLPKEEGWPRAEQVLALCRTRPGFPVTFQVCLSYLRHISSQLPTLTERVSITGHSVVCHSLFLVASPIA